MVSGGQAIEILAQKGDPSRYTGKWEVGNKDDFNFDISKLRGFWNHKVKTIAKNHPDLPVDCPLPEIADIAAGIQRSIVIHLATRINRIVKYLESTSLINLVTPSNYQTLKLNDISKKVDYIDPIPLKLKLVVSGGVACNNYIVDKLKSQCDQMETFYEETNIEVVAPFPRHLCTDNGVMIAWNGVLKLIDYHNNGNDNNIALKEKDIMSLEAINEVQLGVDIRELIDTSWIKVKPLQV